MRLVFRREHLADVPSGVSWQGLRDVFRETLVTRAPETARFELTGCPRGRCSTWPWARPEEGPVTFQVAVRRDGKDAARPDPHRHHPYRWEPRVVDLAEFAGQEVSLSLSATAEKPGTIAFWGAPGGAAARAADEARAGRPRR